MDAITIKSPISNKKYHALPTARLMRQTLEFQKMSVQAEQLQTEDLEPMQAIQKQIELLDGVEKYLRQSLGLETKEIEALADKLSPEDLMKFATAVSLRVNGMSESEVAAALADSEDDKKN